MCGGCGSKRLAAVRSGATPREANPPAQIRAREPCKDCERKSRMAQRALDNAAKRGLTMDPVRRARLERAAGYEGA